MKIIGIDPSINSTGICVNVDNKKYKYHIITNTQSLTKKALNNIPNINDIKYHVFNKEHNDMSYDTKEQCKIYNISQIVSFISKILKSEKPDAAYMEGISYGSGNSSALADLAGLNYMIRYTLYTYFNDINKIHIISPKELKSKASGNGNANKAEMTYLWLKCDPKMAKYNDLKLDDLADAYFLSKLMN